MNYVERHFGDWARDTAHLSMLEDGAYNRLVDLYYVHEHPLPLDTVACCRLVRATTGREREAVRSVLAEFFVETLDGWKHKRCDAEIEGYRSKSSKAQASANARWNANKSLSDGNANASATVLRMHSEGNATRERGHARSQAPNTNPQAPNTPKPRKPGLVGGATVHGYPPGFEAFWSAYPKKEGRKVAEQAFARIAPDEPLLATMLAALRRQAASEQWTKEFGKYVPMPATWLNGRRWEDELPGLEDEQQHASATNGVVL